MSIPFSKAFASTALAACLSSFVAPSARADAAPVGFGPASSSGWLAGAVAGYNWQKGKIVVGIEADASWTSLKSETTGTVVDPSSPNFVFPSGDAIARIDWYGTVRARLGIAAGSFLFYGTGGLAYGNVSLSNRYDLGASGNALSIAPLTSHISSVRAGWVAGLGVDWMLSRNLVAGLQFQYVDLGTVALAEMIAPAPFVGTSSPRASVHAQFQTVTISLSYKFGQPSGPSQANASMWVKAPPASPPPADPWAGLYVGGRVGGTWGNHLHASTPTFQPPTVPPPPPNPPPTPPPSQTSS